jgi:hypothetical protein
MAHKLPYYPVSAKLESNLKLCVDFLPSGAKIGYIGAMLSRPGQGLRLIVGNICSHQLSDYLRQIGWTEPTSTLEFLVSSLSNLVDEIRFLSFDIGETIHPRVGLEFFIEKQPEYEPRWQLFLDHLVEMGLCTLVKKKAFLALSGYSQKTNNGELWPKNLGGGDLFIRLLGTKAVSVFWRAITHVKIVYQPGSPLSAKGYLLFGHNWFDASALTKGDFNKVTN